MSRVHDALRKSEIAGGPAAPGTTNAPAMAFSSGGLGGVAGVLDAAPLHGLLEQIRTVPWDPATEAHLIDAQKPSNSPTEEFRSLRTRLNHIQTLQPLHSLVVTSASPAEGKSFTAANLAIVESHLQGNLTLLCDFDFRRPILHNLFKIDRAPGLTDYLMGKATLGEVIRRIGDSNLFLAPAGTAVINPLELLNLKEVKTLLDRLPSIFNWIVIDSPPMLFAADANLLATLCEGTLLVVRLGQTTIDSVTRALQGMSHNNVLGVVANAAKRGELYSKYTYYQAYYYGEEKESETEPEEVSQADVPATAGEPGEEKK